jgi:hypothetical protein
MKTKRPLKRNLTNGYIMKTKKTDLLIIVVFGLLLVQQCAFSQTSYMKDRWNFQAGYIPDSRKDVSPKANQFRASANYGILNFLEIGAYLGGSNYLQFSRPPQTGIRDAYAPVYGINANAHLLPFLVKKVDFRFDLYLATKFGGYYCSGKETEYFQGAFWQYFIGGGVAFYPFDHLGLFAEYGYENKAIYNGISHNILQVGVSLKFK